MNFEFPSYSFINSPIHVESRRITALINNNILYIKRNLWIDRPFLRKPFYCQEIIFNENVNFLIYSFIHILIMPSKCNDYKKIEEYTFSNYKMFLKQNKKQNV